MVSGTVFSTATGMHRKWFLKAEHHSPRYTKRWSDVPYAYA